MDVDHLPGTACEVPPSALKGYIKGVTVEEARAYLTKAVESLASAQVDYAAARYNSCANRVYYACFQAAVAALLAVGTRPANPRGEWSHEFVQSQFNLAIPPSLLRGYRLKGRV